MKIIAAFFSLLTDYSPDREKRKRLERAEHELVIAEHDLELLNAHVPMLKRRITRLRTELASTDQGDQAKAGRDHELTIGIGAR
jgi:hypothetical protein